VLVMFVWFDLVCGLLMCVRSDTVGIVHLRPATVRIDARSRHVQHPGEGRATSSTTDMHHRRLHADD